jgi:16S rRNA (uracil1498-N3)-methyltransferase
VKPETRLFQAELPSEAQSIDLAPENVRIARDVLRLRIGDPLELVDGSGRMVSATVSKLEKRSGACEVVSNEVSKRHLPEIILLQGTPKGDKSTWVVQKCVEWGVGRVVFLSTDHGVVKKSEGQKERWIRVAQEALRQSGNPFLPQIEGPTSLDDALQHLRADIGICFDENQRDRKLKDHLKNVNVSSVTVAVGPEGGWSNAERKKFEEAGYLFAGFGPYVLRTETAALSAIAFVRALIS